MILTAGAAFEGYGAVQGPYPKSLGWSSDEIGWWFAGPVVVGMILGSLPGGRLADQFRHARVTAVAIGPTAASVAALAGLLTLNPQGETPNWLSMCLLGTEPVCVGLLTASTYSLMMNLTDPRIAAKQFSMFMAAGNGCEAWAAWIAGGWVQQHGYAWTLLTLSGLSLVSMVWLGLLNRATSATDRAMP